MSKKLPCGELLKFCFCSRRRSTLLASSTCPMRLRVSFGQSLLGGDYRYVWCLQTHHLWELCTQTTPKRQSNEKSCASRTIRMVISLRKKHPISGRPWPIFTHSPQAPPHGSEHSIRWKAHLAAPNIPLGHLDVRQLRAWHRSGRPHFCESGGTGIPRSQVVPPSNHRIYAAHLEWSQTVFQANDDPSCRS